MGVVPGDQELMVSWEGRAPAGPRHQLSWAVMRMLVKLDLGVNFSGCKSLSLLDPET